MRKIQILLLTVSVLLITSFSPERDAEMFYATHVQETTFEGSHILDVQPEKTVAAFKLALDEDTIVHYHKTDQEDVYEITLMPEDCWLSDTGIHYITFRGLNVDNLLQRFIIVEFFPLELGVNAISIINTVGETHTRYTIRNERRDYFLKKE